MLLLPLVLLRKKEEDLKEHEEGRGLCREEAEVCVGVEFFGFVGLVFLPIYRIYYCSPFVIFFLSVLCCLIIIDKVRACVRACVWPTVCKN